MMFCSFYETCKKGDDCERALTDEVKYNALVWWGRKDVPISQYVILPVCFDEKLPLKRRKEVMSMKKKMVCIIAAVGFMAGCALYPVSTPLCPDYQTYDSTIDRCVYNGPDGIQKSTSEQVDRPTCD
jgi:hypothetical protein